MATAEDTETPWEDEDRFAVWKLHHVMGIKYCPTAVGVTRNWTQKGLDRVKATHVKKAPEELAHPFYRQFAEEHPLYVIEKLISYPNMSDIRQHLSMMYYWEKNRPHFLIPSNEKDKIVKCALPRLKNTQTYTT